ncbi:hypothetical protein KEM52_000219 [Ascosphaera acerosa]|nr:hypothetical protein KEM52_000219 [Ascosphaera acerosa]
MPPSLPSLTTILVAAVVVYLSTFVVLAILRVATGISVQRVGYLSLNHVAFSPRDGVSVWARVLGVSFHRPSVAHPTWLTLRVADARVTLDLLVLTQEKEKEEARRREREFSEHMRKTAQVASRSRSRTRTRAGTGAEPATGSAAASSAASSAHDLDQDPAARGLVSRATVPLTRQHSRHVSREDDAQHRQHSHHHHHSQDEQPSQQRSQHSPQDTSRSHRSQQQQQQPQQQQQQQQHSQPQPQDQEQQQQQQQRPKHRKCHHRHGRNVSASSTAQSVHVAPPHPLVKQRANSLPQMPSTPKQTPPASPIKPHHPDRNFWRQLSKARALLHTMHSYVSWLALLDIHATDTTVQVLDAGEIGIGSLRLRVDTRKKFFEQGRLFRAQTSFQDDTHTIEWLCLVRRVLARMDGYEPVEILDSVSVNLHGQLGDRSASLSNVGISTKIGRMHVPCDLLHTAKCKLRDLREQSKQRDSDEEGSLLVEFARRKWGTDLREKLKQDPQQILEDAESGDDAADAEEEDDATFSAQDDLKRTEEMRAFLFSLLNDIQEVQIGLSFVKVTHLLHEPDDSSQPYVTIVTHETALDVHQIERHNPAHKMYFQPEDIAHQALLAAMSCSVSIEDGAAVSDRIMYIPMATTTIKTTLLSRFACFLHNPDVDERNSNVLFANLVVSSPAVDFEPKHLSHVVHMAERCQRLKTAQPSHTSRSAKFFSSSHILPKAIIKASVQEPVLRLIIPEMEDPEGTYLKERRYHLLISSVSSTSFDVETVHTSRQHYSVRATSRFVSQLLYYHTAAGNKCRLLTFDYLDFRTHVNATPEITAVASGTLNAVSVHLQTGEVSRGIIQVIQHYVKIMHVSAPLKATHTPKPKLLRRLPPWLLEAHFAVTELSVEVAGVDASLGKTTRGMVVQLQECGARYESQAHQLNQQYSKLKRRTPSYSATSGEHSLRLTSAASSSRKQQQHGATDGRQLAILIRSLEGFVIETAEFMEQESFLAIPRTEIQLSTSSDLQGPILHVATVVKSLYLSYSLYRHYAIGLAICVLHDVFKQPFNAPRKTDATLVTPESLPQPVRLEKITVDAKIRYVQIKATMPADPPIMFQLYTLSAGISRWSAPFVRCALVRLQAGAPKLRGVWARLVSVNNLRISFRLQEQSAFEARATSPDITVATDYIRVGVPHLMVVHHVFDNFVNVAKASAQLHHRFKTRSSTYILEKQPQKPKRVSHICVRSRALLFELEDDAFEYKLSRIYRLGILEQKQRLAREQAFHLKIKKLDAAKAKAQRESPGWTKSADHLQPPPNRHHRLGDDRPSLRRSRSTDATSERSSTPRRPRSVSGTRGLRGSYDPQSASQFTEESRVTREEAWHRLQQHNARSWKARIDSATHTQNPVIRDMRQIFTSADEPPEAAPEDDETVLSIPERPGLMSALITDLNLEINKPSFPIEEYSTFLHTIGKGMPEAMRYTLLVPFSIRLDMGESRVTLRDYPLDLLHIPALKHGQSSRSPCWLLRTDFVIAEEYRDFRSARQVMVNIIPPDNPSSAGFNIDVRRTVSPVKMYSDATFEIHTKQPTVISWGMSYQPVIQDMMKIIEGFTKPEIDPSERVGFWDKIRLCFHSRINVLWKGDGDVHLRLKGSPDPYVVTGAGSGFVMCWRKDVQWEIHTSDDPREFMKVTSGEYFLAIPDYSSEARLTIGQINGSTGQALRPSLHGMSTQSTPKFKKVVMKLSGNVRWLLGLMFERTTLAGERSFDFSPHYGVVLRNPKYISEERLEAGYDAYNGFRSNHIHMSVAVVAPISRVWSLDNREPSASYNTIHLTPKVFTHFFSWWSLFSGVMALPVRQGPLFPGITKSSKKFGLHLATVKYNLFLSPLFVAHVYRLRDASGLGDNRVSATGIKTRIDSIMLDLHQRREQIQTTGETRSSKAKSSQMKINKAQLDFINADFRAVSVTTTSSVVDSAKKVDAEEATTMFLPRPLPIDLTSFEIPDRDFNWVDMDDFMELDWMLWTAAQAPKTQILPLAFSPRFSYYRETDSQELSPGENGYSPFGDEPTHYCVLTDKNDPKVVQAELIRERLEAIQSQIVAHEKMIEAQQARVTKESDAAEGLHRQFDLLLRQGETLQHRKRFLRSWLHRLECLSKASSPTSDTTEADRSSARSDNSHLTPPEVAEISELTDEDDADFNNRFSIHNVQMKWNNALRDIILRYMHQVSQRRGFMYYMSRRAVKFILDVVQEQNKMKIKHAEVRDTMSETESASADSELSVEDRIEQLLGDARRFVEADEVKDKPPERPHPPKRSVSVSSEKELYEISPEFIAINSYRVRLITPQIQLQSDKNTKAVALVTAKGMQLKVISVMDSNRPADDINGLVQRRFTCDMDSAQFFVATRKTLLSSIHMYSGNRYGNVPGSAWPPWVPLESMLDFEIDPTGFSRIIQKTSAALRYDKYNSLRLKYHESLSAADDNESAAEAAESLRHRIDRIQVDFPHVRAICDSSQYYALYIIALDLLMYSEPLEKVRNEKLEKIMLASDFSDLRGAPEMVEKLQQRVQQIEDLKKMFQVQSDSLDEQGWKDRVALEKDLAQCEDELFFIMKAITTSQRKTEERNASVVSGLLRWSIAAKEVVWHLMTDDKGPLAEFQLGDARYERTDNVDGSNYNLLQVRNIFGLNLLPSALYPEMIAPYLEGRKSPPSRHDTMLAVEWFMLEAIAGIPVLENFEVKLFPLKVQLEREMAKKLFEYVFPGVGSSAFDGSGFSPFLVRPMAPLEEEDPAPDEETYALSPNEAEAIGEAAEEESIMSPTDPKPIELRLQPTVTLTDADGLSPSSRQYFIRRHRQSARAPKKKDQSEESSPKSEDTGTHRRLKVLGKKPSMDSIKFLSRANSEKSTMSASSADDNKRRKTPAFKYLKNDNKPKETPDDLSQMVSRASNYMILTHVKISDVVLCLSYKGKGGRNIEDVHNFVFRMPVLEYRNKTWSNLDLALRLKKDLIKALISHAPAILGNKFHHRPTKQQQMHFREVAFNSQVLNGSSTNLSAPHDASSIYSFQPGSDRISFTSHRPSSRASVFSDRPKTAGSILPRVSSQYAHGEEGERSVIDENAEAEGKVRHAHWATQLAQEMLTGVSQATSPSRPRRNIMRRLTGDFHDRQDAKHANDAAAAASIPHTHRPLSTLGRKLRRHDNKAGGVGVPGGKAGNAKE